jgi:dihydroorotate dehydrogenase (fumarate)
MPPRLSFSPPLLNAACPWATDLTFLRPLYASPSTGAITTRTSLVDGYPHDDAVNTFLFFDAGAHDASSPAPASFPSCDPSRTSSLNSFGLSPIKLAGYLDMIRALAAEYPRSTKPIIVSVAGTPASCGDAMAQIAALAGQITIPLAVELNLSCPNVPGHPPPAYYPEELRAFLAAIPAACPLPVGLKTPPYTHADQFAMLVAALEESGRVSFLTSTNTLGNCVVMAEGAGGPAPVLPSDGGFGGMAGPAIHPLSLGNVASLRALLDQRGLDIDIIGVGGVSDGQGFRRMRRAGAKAVAVATALGKQGPAVFDRIAASIGRDAKL